MAVLARLCVVSSSSNAVGWD